jgi:hypothetical protein
MDRRHAADLGQAVPNAPAIAPSSAPHAKPSAPIRFPNATPHAMIARL